MIIDGIDFPNKILEDIKNNKLVVFAGAGASMGAPTSLPDFERLTGRIAEGTGKRKKEQSCEVFLGHLKSIGIDVNAEASAILSESCLSYNSLHKAIINVFSDLSKVKVVTTNYDQMFEKYLMDKDCDIKVYNAPALPLGNDVEGIIHIHGNVENPKYMVVTDDDFGKAYLTEGYVTRFLTTLFETYTILFIGYSYSDVILRYLTRAMTRNTMCNRFILTDNTSDWLTLGITPIYFPKSDYSLLTQSIEKLGILTKRGLLDLRTTFMEYQYEPPQDLSIQSELEYCLLDLEKSRVLSQIIKGEKWFDYLNKKELFQCIFNINKQLDGLDLIWENWIINEFVGKNDNILFGLFLKHGNRVNSKFAGDLLDVLLYGREISKEYLSIYLILFKDEALNSWQLQRIIELAEEKELHNLSYIFFKKLFKVSFRLKNAFFSNRPFQYQYELCADKDTIQNIWDLYKANYLSLQVESLLYFMDEVIHNVINGYYGLNCSENGEELWKLSRIVIEDRYDYSKEEELYIVSKIFVECCVELSKDKGALVKEFLIHCFKEAPFIKKIALKALRLINCITPDEKFDMFYTNVSISFIVGREQVYLLIKSIFNDISEDRKNLLIDEIENISNTDEENNEYEKYNWCVWIKKICQTNTRINLLEESILKSYSFQPREQPEILSSQSFTWDRPKVLIQLEDMKCMEFNALVSLLDSYEAQSFSDPDRMSLLEVFGHCCELDSKWTLDISKCLIDAEVEKEDVWRTLIYSVESSSMCYKEKLEIVTFLINNIEHVSSVFYLSTLLCKIIEDKSVKDTYQVQESRLLNLLESLWNNRGQIDFSAKDIYHIVYDNVLGNLLMATIRLLSYNGDSGIPDRYKDFLEKSLDLKNKERIVSICVIGGNLNFLCTRDCNWFLEKFRNIYEGKESELFQVIWEGYFCFTNSVNKNVADLLLEISANAVNYLNLFEKETKTNFIDLYLFLLIFVADNPCKDYIPKLYNLNSDQNIEIFLERIESRLQKMENKDIWWNSWLKQFFINRFQNKPKPLLEKEKSLLFMCALELESYFEEVFTIIIDKPMPKKVESMFLYKIHKKGLDKKYPKLIIQLLIEMLNENTEFGYAGGILKDISSVASELDIETKNSFHEALLKRGYNIID